MHENDISAICDILMDADAITCIIESYEPDLYYSNAIGYCVKVDYNKLAKAIYEAGYRKLKGENNV